ncbi:MAG: PH domain-containing protein [Blautia sp.]|nr:PH domain-containing protein [Blautia sp.]
MAAFKKGSASDGASAKPGKAEKIWKDRKHFMWFPFSFTRYYIQNGRIYVEKGLLSTTSDQTLLYRITDIQLRRSFGQKLFGTGTVCLVSNVDAEPHLFLENIKEPKKVYDLIANLVEESRTQKNVIGKEFYARGGHDFDHNPGCPPPNGMPPHMPVYDSMDDDATPGDDMDPYGGM